MQGDLRLGFVWFVWFVDKKRARRGLEEENHERHKNHEKAVGRLASSGLPLRSAFVDFVSFVV